MGTTLAEWLLSCTDALANCKRSGNAEWEARWKARLAALERMLPSGSGVDCGTKIVSVTETTIALDTQFHHMNDAGMYDGWTAHRVTAKATFGGIRIRIGGKDRNQIKDYLHDVYREALDRVIEWSEESQRWIEVKP